MNFFGKELPHAEKIAPIFQSVCHTSLRLRLRLVRCRKVSELGQRRGYRRAFAGRGNAGGGNRKSGGEAPGPALRKGNGQISGRGGGDGPGPA